MVESPMELESRMERERQAAQGVYSAHLSFFRWICNVFNWWERVLVGPDDIGKLMREMGAHYNGYSDEWDLDHAFRHLFLLEDSPEGGDFSNMTAPGLDMERTRSFRDGAVVLCMADVALVTEHLGLPWMPLAEYRKHIYGLHRCQALQNPPARVMNVNSGLIEDMKYQLGFVYDPKANTNIDLPKDWEALLKHALQPYPNYKKPDPRLNMAIWSFTKTLSTKAIPRNCNMRCPERSWDHKLKNVK